MPVESKGKGADKAATKGGRGKPMANPMVTKLKQERKETAHTDSDSHDKAQSVKSGSAVPKRGMGHVQLENTYKLTPNESERFIAHRVRNVAEDVLASVIAEVTYDPKTVPALVKTIVEQVKEKTKELRMSRHKIVVHAVVGERGEQSLKSASRCLWNDKFDSFTTAQFMNNTMFALVTVYGVYLE